MLEVHRGDPTVEHELSSREKEQMEESQSMKEKTFWAEENVRRQRKRT